MSEPLLFNERVVVVTGAGRGIGRCYALELAARGASVVVADNGSGIDGSGGSADPARQVVDEITEAGGSAVACVASVTDEAAAGGIIETALTRFGRIDAVINNAGIHDPGPFTELSIDQYRTMLDVHYFGTLYLTRAVWPHFVDLGYGRVVNTVSEAMFGGIAELSSYGSAKGAVLGLTRNLATEGYPHGIAVNAVVPRAHTRMSGSHSDKLAADMGVPQEVMDQINASMPPQLCAPAAVYLAHPSCSISGEMLRIGLGGVARIAIVHSTGLDKPDLSAEDIAENIDAVMDLTGAQVALAVPV
ncbi:short-chain dehydrogenase [Mycolicibacterium insubricum]|jgi:NAD(P)-dependent dehydrogenase (short-subunit alcohol dehydrogenase family)|uniref:Ketoreductase domain-containing protein n=1 Tax=Mycolicibacterium insubricum TaxID=444597 RepID=A0A1X0DN88_9MYCO|nr:SDR family NAD(P)-dependent oxidoreductase [Mycolicibacterium insubricum]MCB9441834.1 SDR family NAD(P)-dependent oxidoreductase [Mycolicibacterium sp.]MCV7082164.1 SDR family NAD(P)-dependent oxidoreductase [Mycolicibacterium insubricum]ORA73853.1 hypothetical protein BST26_01385 [Mycolicibacterium insubricum]BBZ67443.1 short-chain dehydrogenase [Mycolicibacterium insubricum]